MQVLDRQHRDSIKEARKLMRKTDLAMHIGSVAIAVEALETLLIERGILKDDELLQRIKIISQQHYAAGNFIPPGED